MELWLDKRNPRRSEVVLEQNRIFIFPSSAGLGFLVMLLGLLLLAINYQNNLIFALSFSLFSLFLVAILHTYANVSGIRLRAGVADPVFAGELAHFHLHVHAQQRPRHQLRFNFAGGRFQWLELSAPLDSGEVVLPWPAERRGKLVPGRLQLRSDFPLGIIRCWAMPALDWHCLVYPQPRLLRPLHSFASEGEGEHLNAHADGDEFSGFERYQPGEPPRRIFWKAYAKGQGLLSKRFEQNRADELVLHWDSLAGLAVEDRLSTLCAWALDCEQRGLYFALVLPGVSVEQGSGPVHLARVLRELALFEGGQP